MSYKITFLFCLAIVYSDAVFIVRPKKNMVVFQGDTVVLHCSSDNIIPAAWSWFNFDSANDRTGKQTDLYNYCEARPNTIHNIFVETNTKYVYDLTIKNITIENAGMYVCMECCGQLEVTPSDIVVIFEKPKCEELNITPRETFIKTFQKKEFYDYTYTKIIRCTFEYNGLGPLIGHYSISNYDRFHYNESFSITNRNTKLVVSDFRIKLSIFSNKEVYYEIKSEKYSFNSEKYLVKRIYSPYNLSIIPYADNYDIGDNITCKANGNNNKYYWINEKTNDIIGTNNTLTIRYIPDNIVYNIQCLVANNDGIGVKTIYFIINENISTSKPTSQPKKKNLLMIIISPIIATIVIILVIIIAIIIKKRLK